MLSIMVASGHWDPRMLEAMSTAHLLGGVIQPELRHVILLLEHAVRVSE